METFYWAVFGGLLAAVIALQLSNRSANKLQTSDAFKVFKNNYLIVYCLMMAGDWLQGPYVYALYQSYGFDRGAIGRLFIAGFGSSMLFGTVVGSLADKQGRRLACLTYCLFYTISCLTKHSPNFYILLLGRLAGGVSTSLLFSAFESWLVAEHFKRGFPAQWLSLTFSHAIFLGNGLTAILAGLLANTLVSDLHLGPTAPFDAAIAFLTVGASVIVASWTENYGSGSEGGSEKGGSGGVARQLSTALQEITSDPKIALLGAIQSLFEAAMYTFVFLWTPALSPSHQSLPHGFIFSTFMLACMLGSSLATRLLAQSDDTVKAYMQLVFVLAALFLAVPVVVLGYWEPSPPSGGGITAGGQLQLLAFCCFEACVGAFWPSIMRMRAQHVPEGSRATILTLFRIPLNLFVCVVLFNVQLFPTAAMFAMCSSFLALAALLQRQLLILCRATQASKQSKIE